LFDIKVTYTGSFLVIFPCMYVLIHSIFRDMNQNVHLCGVGQPLLGNWSWYSICHLKSTFRKGSALAGELCTRYRKGAIGIVNDGRMSLMNLAPLSGICSGKHESWLKTLAKLPSESLA
jgi:hypothetical protein